MAHNPHHLRAVTAHVGMVGPLEAEPLDLALAACRSRNELYHDAMVNAGVRPNNDLAGTARRVAVVYRFLIDA